MFREEFLATSLTCLDASRFETGCFLGKSNSIDGTRTIKLVIASALMVEKPTAADKFICGLGRRGWRTNVATFHEADDILYFIYVIFR